MNKKPVEEKQTYKQLDVYNLQSKKCESAADYPDYTFTYRGKGKHIWQTEGI